MKAGGASGRQQQRSAAGEGQQAELSGGDRRRIPADHHFRAPDFRCLNCCATFLDQNI